MLDGGHVICHPFVIGELACGRLKNRSEILGLLSAIPQARVADHGELLHLIDVHRLYGRGLGWVDVHLIASALLSSCDLWSSDKALQDAARHLGIAASTSGVH
jgi:predicted nucleic acid-binding protein